MVHENVYLFIGLPQKASVQSMNWRLKLFNLIPKFLKRVGCQLLRRLGYDPDAWLENFLREHKGD